MDSGHPELPDALALLELTTALVGEERFKNAELAVLDARQELLEVAGQPTSAANALELLRLIPSVVERFECVPLWERLLEFARDRASSSEQRERVKWVDIQLRLLLALERTDEFIAALDAVEPQLEPGRNAELFRGVGRRLKAPRSAVFAESKVFGIGLSRTGTKSLNEALMILGIESAHWTNPLTFQLVGELDAYIFGGCSDLTITCNFEPLYYTYPNAKFVWTKRPLSSWQPSYERHYATLHGASRIPALRAVFSKARVHYGFAHALAEWNLYMAANDLAQAYENHATRVRHFFSDKPPGKLLELDIVGGHGWRELCQFLQVPEPTVDFPHLY